MQQTEGYIEKRPNLPIFQANVGEGVQRSFQYDAHRQALYTDVETTNPQGGYDSTVEVCITSHDKDEFAVRCWEMTAAYRARYDADAQNANRPADEVPTEGPGIPLNNEDISESTPVVSEAEREHITDIRQIPTHFTSENPPPTFSPQEPQLRMVSEDDLLASVIMTNQRSAIDDLHTIIDLYVEDEKASQFANRIYERLGRLYDDYGIGKPNKSTQGSDLGGDSDAEG